MNTILPALILFAFSVIVTDQTKNEHKTQIVYVFDPLCGWCYGFAPVITNLLESHSHYFDFEIISGGMITGDREGPIRSMSDYILNAIPGLESHTGVHIGQPYIEMIRDGSYYASSVKPSKALIVFKHLSENKHFRFAHDIQKAMFVHGKNLNDMDTYLEILQHYPINPDEFVACMEDESFLQKTLDEFMLAASMGVTGYPTVLARHNNSLQFVSRGYVSASELNTRLQKIK